MHVLLVVLHATRDVVVWALALTGLGTCLAGLREWLYRRHVRREVARGRACGYAPLTCQHPVETVIRTGDGVERWVCRWHVEAWLNDIVVGYGSEVQVRVTGKVGRREGEDAVGRRLFTEEPRDE